MANPCIEYDCAPAGFGLPWLKWLVPLLLGLLLLLPSACNPALLAPAAVAIPDDILAEVPEEVAPPTVDASTCSVDENGMITFSGTGQAGSEISIRADGSQLGQRASVGGDGTWSVEIPFVKAGTYSMEAVQLDGGTVLSSNSACDVTVNSVGGVPVEVEACEPTVSVSANSITTGDSVTFSGTALAGREVWVVENSTGVVLGKAPVDSSGNWSVDTTSLTEGNQSVELWCMDGTTRTAVVSSSDTIAVGGVVAEAPKVHQRPVIASLTGATAAGIAADMVGTAEPNSEVIIYVNGEEVARTDADAGGNWTLNVASLPCGENNIFARSEFDDADVVKQSNTVRATVEEGCDIDLTAALADGSSSSVGITGGFAPGDSVTVSTGGNDLGSADVSDDGTYDFQATCSLPPGEYEFNVTSADGSQTETLTVTIENAAPAYVPPAGGPNVKIVCEGTPAMGEIQGNIYVVAQCEYLSLIAQRMGTSTALLIEYNPQLSNPSALYAGQLLNIPASADCLNP